MLKKSIAFLLACLVVLSLAGCMKETPGEPESTSPSLVPYLSGYKYDEENGYWTEKFYGLMTADGEKVTEPVYDQYRIFELNGKTYYCMQISADDWLPICSKSLLISADGNFKLELEDNILAISENRIICAQHEEPFTVYDYSGNRIFSGNENQSVDTNGSGFYNGLLVVFDFFSENGYTTVVDENGETVLDKLDYCGSFITGKAVASYNRDEGYGIITPEGEWLLEPKYTDIKDVEGKYFIAIEFDKEYIYDSDLNLLRERQDDWDIYEQNYFFETQGKLVRYYSHMDSPDDYYRDAFTDEKISCGDVFATSYDEESDLFYGINDGKLCIFDVNGKLLNECQGTERAEMNNGAYAAVTSSKEQIWFNSASHEKIINLSNAENEWKSVATAGDCGIAVIADLEDKQDSRMDGPYHLYDYKNREYIFRDCEYCDINEFDGEIYITVAYTDHIKTYDADFNLLIETENLCENR